MCKDWESTFVAVPFCSSIVASPIQSFTASGNPNPFPPTTWRTKSSLRASSVFWTTTGAIRGTQVEKASFYVYSCRGRGKQALEACVAVCLQAFISQSNSKACLSVHQCWHIALATVIPAHLFGLRINSQLLHPSSDPVPTWGWPRKQAVA